MAVIDDRLIDSFRAEPRSLSQTVASIQRLVRLQTRDARGDSEADQACVAAFANFDAEVQKWALHTSVRRIKTPSLALADALLAHWKNDTDVVPKTWPHDAGLVANAVVRWRLRRAAPLFAETLKTSRDDSLSDLRRGAKDAHEQVRARVVVDSYNLLEFEQPDRRWAPASRALIAEVRAFLTEMQRDPARLVSTNAKTMLVMIARQRPL